MRILIYFILLCCSFVLCGAPLCAAQQPLHVEAAFRLLPLRGYTRSLTTATIAAEVSGRVTRLNYDVGDKIGGKALLRIDDTFIRLDLKNSSLAMSRNQIAQKQAQLRLDWLDKEFQRRTKLVHQQRISQVAFDEISQQRDQAALELRQRQLQQQELEVQHQILIEKLQRHQPHAATGWIVSKKFVEQDDFVQIGKPLMQVGNYQQLLVPLAVTPAELKAIRATHGDGAFVDEQPISFHLATVSPAFDETTRKINIEVQIDNFDGEKLGGLPFALTVRLPAPGLMLPVTAISNRYQHPKVQPLKAKQPVAIEILDHIQTKNGDWVRIRTNSQLPVGTALRASGEQQR